MDLALLLLAGEPNAASVARLFVGFFLILALYLGALGFTYWISKEE